jgi:hypothetical protein
VLALALLGVGHRAALAFALARAVSRGDACGVRDLLAMGAEPGVRRGSALGGTVLHTAVERGDAAMSEDLLAAGADPDARDNEGKAPLHYAASAGDEVLTEMLLDWGATVDSASRAGDTPLMWSASLGRTTWPTWWPCSWRQGQTPHRQTAKAVRCWRSPAPAATSDAPRFCAERTSPDGSWEAADAWA